MKVGVMLCGHGSRSQAAVDEFAALARALPAHLPADWDCDHGYLEFANPVLRVGLDRLREKGCDRILAVPGMLFAAMHAKNDIPTVLTTYAAEHGIEVSYGRELGVDPKLLSAAGDRIMAAVEAASADMTTAMVAMSFLNMVLLPRVASLEGSGPREAGDGVAARIEQDQFVAVLGVAGGMLEGREQAAFGIPYRPEAGLAGCQYAGEGDVVAIKRKACSEAVAADGSRQLAVFADHDLRTRDQRVVEPGKLAAGAGQMRQLPSAAKRHAI